MMVSKEEMVDALKTAAVSRCFFGSRFVSCYWRSPAGLIKFKGSNLNVSGHRVKPFTPNTHKCNELRPYTRS